MSAIDANLEQAIEDIGAGESATPVLPSEPHLTNIPYKGVITACVMLATTMQTLDSTIANVALPDMQGSFAATQDEMGWVLTSYIVAAAITIPLGGWFANEFGRRRILISSIAVFTAASALAGVATSLPQMVLARCLQGVGGAALVPLSQAVLFDINSAKDIGRAMAIWGMGVAVGPIMGPVLGGWLTQHYSWHWVFYINVPIGIAAFAGLYLTMPETRNAERSRFDFFGFAALSAAIAAFQLMLDRGQIEDWFSSTEIVTEALIAATALYLFLVHMFSSRDPFLNAGLFRDRNFVVSNLFIALMSLFLFATLALLPPMLQNQMQYPEELTGLVIAPRGFGGMIATMFAGRLIGRIDTRLIIAAGLLTTSFALWQMSHFSLTMSYWTVVQSGLTQGLGVGMIFVPLSTTAFSTLPPRLRNEGTAFFNLMRNMGSSVGISVVFFILTQNTQRVHSALASDVTPYGAAARAAARHFDLDSLTGLAALDSEVTRQSAMIATLDDFKLMMMLALIAVPFLLLLKPAATKHEKLQVAE